MDSNAKQTRYSLDCRFSKDFDRSDEKAAVKKEAPEGLHTLYASPGPASKIRTVTFNPNGSLLYTPHESHPDVENGTPTYDGYYYAKKHSKIIIQKIRETKKKVKLKFFLFLFIVSLTLDFSKDSCSNSISSAEVI